MSNLDIAQGMMKAWEDRDAAKAASLLSDSFVLTGPIPVPADKNAYLTLMRVHNIGFPNWKFNAHDWHENGDTVTVTAHITATHTGTYDVSPLGLPLPPIPATGKTPLWGDDAFTFTITGGKIVALEVRLGKNSGVMGTLAQLGVSLPPA